MAEQLVDVLSFVAEYEKEMDRIEDLILVGSLSALLTGRRGGAGEQLLFLRIEEEEKEEEEEEVAERPVGGQFLVKVVAVPVVVRRQVLGSPWCASATDMDFVEEIRLCVSSWSRSWSANASDHGGFRRAADHGGNHGGDSAGDKVVDMLVTVQRQVLGEDRAQN